ncbi:hypothetical protein FHX45_001622 [Amycolatopsis granulosa]|nr:hypothetical protein [Amycolatopsis granulosa]
MSAVGSPHPGMIGRIACLVALTVLGVRGAARRRGGPLLR